MNFDEWKKGPVKLIQWVKINNSFLQVRERLALTGGGGGGGEGRELSKKQRLNKDDPSILAHFCMTLPNYQTDVF